MTGSLTVDPGSEFTGDPTATLFIDGNVTAISFDFNLGIEDIDIPGTNSDLLQLSGVLDLTSVTDAMLNVEDLTGGTPDLLTTEFMLLFAQSATDILGFDAGNFTVNAVGEYEGELSVIEQDNGLFLVHSIALIPEPHSIAIWTLLGLALTGFGYYRARRNR